LTAAALVEQDDAIGSRVMHLAQEGRYAASRPPMQHKGRLSRRIAALLVVKFMER
jgi:hypothetical protein